ncbi:metallophosphoesterase family protein [Desertivirga brevis]|uniref:metallophosphoesterase family protein n=1 Tax=Desertivirga brevis TaxID=2810310 RepID=UPI001A971EEA|nr:exonuclease SbcCD subunit D [Pedobacter sp. SYSU D00873]
MKILHTADWHLGKRLEKFSRLEEQKEVLAEIIDIADAHDVDAVLVAGDLFDSFNPSTEAIELLYKTLKRLTNNGRRAVVAIAGNHDSPDRIEAPDPLARECGIIFAGYPDSHVSMCELESGVGILQSEPGFIELKLPRHDAPLRLLLTPYANEYRLKTFLGLENSEEELRQVLQRRWKELADKYCDDKGVNMLVTHLFMMKKGEEPPEEPEDEKPILHVGGAQAVYSENIPLQIQYAALGHLHGFRIMDNSPCPVVYSSSPLSYSFGEAGHKKYVVLIDAEPGKQVKYEGIKLSKGRPLARKRFTGVDDALQWLSENQEALVELTLVTDNYLTADERKRLTQAHEGIVTIIPEVRNPDMLHSKGTSIDLSQDIEDLFGQFFQHRHGQLPNTELINLFKEIRAEQHEE